MFKSKPFFAVLLILAAVLVVPGFQALANHTADVGFRILKVRVLGDTDDWPAGCSDVYVTVEVTSTIGQIRGAQTGVAEEICPVQTIFQNVLLNLTPNGQSKIVTGPFKLRFRVMDEDDLSADDEMNNKTVHNIPCNGKSKTINDLAKQGQSADIKVRVRCTPIKHAGSASELDGSASLTRPSDDFRFAQQQIFDAAGRKVLDVANMGQKLESLVAQGRLASGVYFIITTEYLNGQPQRRLGKAVVLPSGQIQISSSGSPRADREPASEELSLGNQLVPQRGQLRFCFGGSTLTGGPGPDLLVGTAGADVIFGKAGNDTIDGGAGNDFICGDLGNDHLTDGPGIDKVFGGHGKDVIRLVSDGTLDRVYAGPGNDTVYVAFGAGETFVDCGSGFDRVFLNGNNAALVSLNACESVIP